MGQVETGRFHTAAARTRRPGERAASRPPAAALALAAVLALGAPAALAQSSASAPAAAPGPAASTPAAPAAAAPGGPSPEAAVRGRELYGSFCARCHGINKVTNGMAFDLRTFPPDEKDRFVRSVTQGLRAMPAWGERFKPAEIDALWAFVLQR